MRKWIAILLAVGLLLPVGSVLAARVKGAFQSVDVTDNVVAGGVVTGTLNVSGTPTFTDNTINGADLIDNTVTSAKILDNTIALGKINSSGTKDDTTFLRGDGVFTSNTKPYRGALVYLSADQNTDNAANTYVSFDSEDHDTNNIHNPNDNTILTVPSGASKVRLTARITWNINDSGFRWTKIIKNGTSYIGEAGLIINANAIPSGNYLIILLSTPVLNVSPGDNFILFCQQTSGGVLKVKGSATGNYTWFSMEIIE